MEMLFTYLLANAKPDVGVAAHVQELVDMTPKNESVQPFFLILVFLGLVHSILFSYFPAIRGEGATESVLRG